MRARGRASATARVVVPEAMMKLLKRPERVRGSSKIWMRWRKVKPERPAGSS
jgi:hypothetical protein